MYYASDFETSTKYKDEKPEAAIVYAWGCLDSNNNYKMGRSIDGYINYIRTLNSNSKIYFHNLKFDGSFILNYVLGLENSYYLLEQEDYYFNEDFNKNKKYIFYEKELEQNLIDNYPDSIVVNSNINNMGLWYSLTLYFIENGKCKKIDIYDSTKLLNMSLKELGEKFLGLPEEEQKEELDYSVYRTPETPLTEEERHYLFRDCEILMKGLKVIKGEYKLIKNTSSSASLWEFKQDLAKDTGLTKAEDIDEFFRTYFPILDDEETEFATLSYKGGISHVSKEYVNKILGNGEKEVGLVVDYNSMYPSVMTAEGNKYPMGFGKYGVGECNEELFIQRLRCKFKLKLHKLPLVNLKSRDFKGFNLEHKVELEHNKLLYSSQGQIVELVLNNIDLELLKENYDLEEVDYIDFYSYEVIEGIFDSYIGKWEVKKQEAVEEGNKSKKGVAKLIMNGGYGKFGSSTCGTKKIPYVEEQVLKFKSTLEKKIDPVYMPMASFITAYARKELNKGHNLLVELGEKLYGKDYYAFAYCDTDSLHFFLTEEDIRGSEFEEWLDDGSSFGKWKIENKIYKGIYLRSKTYLEQQVINEDVELFNNDPEEFKKKFKPKKIEVPYATACAGLPKKAQVKLDFNNFKLGEVFKNVKLMPKQVKGGVALVDTDFELSEKVNKRSCLI